MLGCGCGPGFKSKTRGVLKMGVEEIGGDKNDMEAVRRWSMEHRC